MKIAKQTPCVFVQLTVGVYIISLAGDVCLCMKKRHFCLNDLIFFKVHIVSPMDDDKARVFSVQIK